MHDAGVRRHDREVLERRLAPAQERVALAVARELDRRCSQPAPRDAVLVDLHRVIDDELGRCERIDALRIAAQSATIASRIAARSTTQGRR